MRRSPRRRGKHGQVLPAAPTNAGRVTAPKVRSGPKVTTIAEAKRSLEDRLKRYSTDRHGKPLPVPDYVSFCSWAGSWLFGDKPGRHVHPVLRAPQPRARSASARYHAFADIYFAIHGHVSAIARSQSAEDSSDALAPEVHAGLNRLKLLMGLINQAGPRFAEVIEALHADKVPIQQLEHDLADCSQAQLRARFFAAVDAGRDRAALRILGKLKEEAHDPGELAYLDAVCDYHANDWAGVIRFAAQVKDDQPDYPGAQALLMEAYAQSGNCDELLQLVNDHVGQPPSFERISPFYLLYVLQVLVARASEPEMMLEKAATSLEALPKWTPDWTDPTEALLTRQSCELATELAERGLEARVREAAVEQSSLDAANSTDQSTDRSAPLSLRDRQLHCALGLHSALYHLLTDQSVDEWSSIIMRVLMNPPRLADHEDYKIALSVQWRLGERDHFLDNVCRSVNEWPLEKDPELWNLVLLAYQQALSVDDLRAVNLEEKLSHWDQYALAVAKARAGADSDALTRSLTPMGCVSYQTGVMSHDHAIEMGEGWKDAGPISLTFFRTLELELNHRLMKPALQEIGADAIHDEWQKLKAAVGAGEDNAPARTKKERTIADFWKRNVPVLVNFAEGKTHGLELGGLELVLRKVVDVSGPDADLKALLRNGIRRQLTEEGARAFDHGILAQRIGEEKRERFRNPPAHTRYLPLTVAAECRAYVEESLRLFKSWFVL